MKYYAAGSDHGTSSSHGFANDWTVYIFNTKQSRDDFVNNSDNITMKAVKRSDATRYATNMSLTTNHTNAPVPFSGEYWGISDIIDNINNCTGTLVCCDDGTMQRFYK